MPPPRSDVWKHFVRVDKTTARCRHCLKTFKSSGNTTNLAKHLKIHSHFNSATKTDGSIGDDEEDLEENENGTLEDTSTKTSASGSTVASELKKTVSCHSNLLSAFQKVSSFQVGGSKHAAITNCILYFICADKRPFDVVKGRGFKKLMSEVAPLYKIPCVDTLKSRLIDKYVALHAIYREKFETIKYFSLTCDVWTETMTNRSFLGVTIHYIDKSIVKLTSVDIAVQELRERHTAVYLSEQLNQILEDWNIKIEKIVAVITDNGANIVAAAQCLFGKSKHITCFAHTLNLVTESALELPEAVGIISKVREVIKFIKSSVIVTDLIRKKHIESGVPEGEIKKVILDVKTRWNSTYYMLERFLELSKIISLIFLEMPKAPPMPTALELETIKGILTMLQPLEFMTKEASGEQYVTVSKLVPMINCAIDQLRNFDFESPILTNVKTKLIQSMDKRFGRTEHIKIVAIATILDPRFKNLHFKDPLAASNALITLKNNVAKNLLHSSSSSDTEENTTSTGTENSKTFDFWSYHKALVNSQKDKKSSQQKSTLPDSVSNYLNHPVCRLDLDPLSEWEEKKSVYPELYDEAIRHLTVVGTSVPAERLFSKAGITITHLRNRLGGKLLNKLLFLGSLNESDWFHK